MGDTRVNEGVWIFMKKITLSQAKKKAWDRKVWNAENRDRINQQNNDAKKRRKLENPVRYKAQTLMMGLLWGKGGTNRMEVLIRKYLGKECKYCGILLEIKNLSLDHKIPHITDKRRKKLKKIILRVQNLTPEESVRRNSEENLHIVCFSCNRMKSNLTDDQFTKLLNFLNQDLQMKEIVCAKLKMSNFIWKR